MAKKVQHGANLFDLQKKYGFKLEEIMDFSSNINPFGPDPESLQVLVDHIDMAKVYPDPAYVDLRQSISAYTGCDPDHIVLGAGTTDLLASYIGLVHPEKALLNSPCYSEYERELDKIGAQVFHYNLDKTRDFVFDVEEIIDLIQKNSIDLYVLTNPNNPTGSVLKVGDVEKILDQTEAHLLIDETYIEFTDKEKYTSTYLASQKDRLFVVRSTSKFFASPGIRLGYGILSEKEYLDKLTNELTLWGVNIYADLMGTHMFQNKAYQDQVYAHTEGERRRMMDRLSKLKSIKVYPSFGNFILVELLEDMDAKTLRDQLLPRKLVIRDCASFPNLSPFFFRFCILSKEENDLLLDGLEDLLD